MDKEPIFPKVSLTVNKITDEQGIVHQRIRIFSYCKKIDGSIIPIESNISTGENMDIISFQNDIIRHIDECTRILTNILL